jgi:hypothetical protein
MVSDSCEVKTKKKGETKFKGKYFSRKERKNVAICVFFILECQFVFFRSGKKHKIIVCICTYTYRDNINNRKNSDNSNDDKTNYIYTIRVYIPTHAFKKKYIVCCFYIIYSFIYNTVNNNNNNNTTYW